MNAMGSVKTPAIEGIYPLSPMQEGMLFHTVYAPGEGAYVQQIRDLVVDRRLPGQLGQAGVAGDQTQRLLLQRGLLHGSSVTRVDATSNDGAHSGAPPAFRMDIVTQ